MGGSSKQVIGYQYFTNLLLFIGNPIEKMLGINFDKRGWINPLVDEAGNALQQGSINQPYLYGENEGGVAGVIHARYGTDNQEVLSFYKDYMESKELQASAYPYQSYLAFTGLGKVNTGNGFIDGAFGALAGYMNDAFYVGNSGYMKEMLLWPKRIHVRNDSRTQWYDLKAEVPTKKNAGGDINPQFVLTANSRSFLDSLEKNNLTTTRPWNDFINDVTTYNSYGASYTQDENWAGEYPSDFPYATVSIECECSFNSYGVIRAYGEFRVDASSWSFKTSGNLVGGGVSYITKNKELGNSEFRIGYDAYFLVKPGEQFKITVIGTDFKEENINTRRLLNIQHLENWVESPKHFFLVDSGDMNPIHKIREILTDDTAMNKPESDINDANFKKAADQIWDEGLGISWAITEKSCLDAINELCGHIEAGVRVNRQTGFYEVVLFRDDWFDENEIHTLAANKIKSLQLEVQNADEAINQLNVSYYNQEAIKDSSFSVAENASIKNLGGRVNAEEVKFPYFMNQRNAAVVAQWKLKQLSSPVWQGSFTTGFYEARKWNRYDLLKLAWPRKWNGAILVRIMKINLGTGTDVSIDFIEVVPYSSELTSNIIVDTPIDVAPVPPQTCQYEPFEMPYYLAVMALGQRRVDDELAYENNFGLVGVVAEKPQSNSLNAIMMTNSGVASEEWIRAATINYDATADLDQIISRTTTSFTVKNSSAITSLPTGTLIKCGRDWLGTPGEWMVFQNVDPYTGVVNVKRGALDTPPQEWGINTKLYFCGNDVTYDTTEYVLGEEVLVSALTTTPSGVLEQGGSIPVEMKARAIRPYPPANVKINGEYWPEKVQGDLDLTWSDRNRIQQTGGEILGWYESDVTLEPNVTYQLEVYEIDINDVETQMLNVNVGTANSYTVDLSTSASTIVKYRVKLYAVRDTYTSYLAFEHTLINKNNQAFFQFGNDAYTPPALNAVDFIFGA